MAWAKTVEMPSDIESLTDEQIISWYARHPHPTVRSLANRLRTRLAEAQEACIQAYEEGLKAGKPNHGLTHAELACAPVYSHSDGMYD